MIEISYKDYVTLIRKESILAVRTVPEKQYEVLIGCNWQYIDLPSYLKLREMLNEK